MTAEQIASVRNLSSVDAEYTFGRHPSAAAPFPFTTREYGRLLVLKSRLQDRAMFATTDAEYCFGAAPRHMGAD